MPIAIKYCAAQIISAGGRLVKKPLKLKTAAKIRGPNIEAPNKPTFFAILHPKTALTKSSRSCRGWSSFIGIPGGLVRFISQNELKTMGKITTITKIRVACIRETERTLAPASSANTIISCTPPGIDEKYAVGKSNLKNFLKNNTPNSPIRMVNSGIIRSVVVKLGIL